MYKKISLLISLFFIFSCTKQSSPEQMEKPQGFSLYSENIQPNERKNLFFFHLHHCPNCTLTQNHLINTQAFQDLTKSYNRYFLELGNPLGKKMMNKYSVRGAPVFVVADKDFNIVSRSPYGLLGFSIFKDWLINGKASLLKNEKQVADNISKKFSIPLKDDFEGLFQLFSQIRKKPQLIKDTDQFYNYSLQQLKEWGSSDFDKKDRYANHYRLGLSFMSLASIYENQKTRYSQLLNEFLDQFQKINSGDYKADYGSYIFQINAHIRLKNDKKANELIKLMEKENPQNKTILYSGVAYAYLKYRDDCEKVFEYTNKQKLTEIPIQTDRIYQVFFRAQCHKKNKNLKALKNEFQELDKVIDPELKVAFPDRIKKIEEMITELEKQNL